ncbi:MAG: hypothetical protein HWE27_12080 [Gammaproteobacteria bacterium]|nr:hypothetical protein [Gammaproteobacteria bacterium]
MKLEEATKIYDYLSVQPSEGKPASAIASELKLSEHDVTKIVTKLTSSFVQTNGGANYAVNQSDGANRDSLISEFKQKTKSNKHLFLFWFIFVMCVSLTTIFASK